MKLPEPEACRFDFDGYGWDYRDNGSGSSWKDAPVTDKEFMYTEAQMRQAIKDALARGGSCETCKHKSTHHDFDCLECSQFYSNKWEPK